MFPTKTSVQLESEENEFILIVTDDSEALDFREENTGLVYTEDDVLDLEEADALLECEYSSRTFPSKSSPDNHEEYYTTESIFCEICCEQFRHRRDLEEHLLTHRNSDYCELQLENNHKVSSMHKESKREVFECPCSRVFKRQFHYEKHMLAVHGKRYNKRFEKSDNSTKMGNDGSYKCVVCLKLFKCENSLKAHLKVHSTNTYECPECSKKITSKGWFEQHLILHSTVRPFQCSVCKKSFPDEKRLKRHEYIHGTSIYKCTMCSAKFTQKYLLLNHNKIHITGSNNSNNHLRVLHCKSKLER